MNRVTLVATRFENIHSSPPNVSYGFRIFDDEGQSYYNLSETPPPKDPLKFLAWALPKLDQEGQGMLDYVIKHKIGLYINDNCYGWKKIQPIIKRWIDKH
jgi:hypothetical protein